LISAHQIDFDFDFDFNIELIDLVMFGPWHSSEQASARMVDRSNPSLPL
jgi:hypothetical protein